MPRTKPLTEGGSLGFNRKPGSIRPSTNHYINGLNTFLLNKEIGEYTSRFTWKGLPEGLDSNILETMLYYKGQVALFKLGENYYVLPFVYTGPINQYGVQTHLIPISFNGTVDDNSNENKNIQHFANQRVAVFYDRPLQEDDKDNIAIVLKSHSSLYLNNVIPTIVLTDEVRDKLAENLLLIRNNIILSQPMKYVNAPNEAAAKSLQIQFDNMLNDILNGSIVQAITGQFTLNELDADKPGMDAQNMWQSYASLDNLRMEFLGILNNGVFEKKERFLSDEVAGKQTVAKLLLQDSLERRKVFCMLANKHLGLNISVEVCEMITPEEQSPEKDNREKERPKNEV